jgi:hypothetical protein
MKIRIHLIQKYSNHLLFLSLLFNLTNSFAFSQDEKLWLGVNAKQTLSQHWATFIFSQIRLKNQPHPLQVGLLEGGVGYHFVKSQSFWVGYRWSGHNPYNGFYQVNRLFQQFIYEINPAPSDQIVLRSRLEEIKHGNSSQISVKLRQRVAWQIKKELVVNVRPFLYDEFFFQLHNTQYTSNKLINENRIFIGFNFYSSKKVWWEIGYINQYQLKTPQDNQNIMSHVVSFTYNFS